MAIKARQEVLYLDNASTSFPKPPEVLDAYINFMKHIGTSPGRGSYDLAIEAGKAVFETRRLLAKLLGTKNTDSIIFTKNATEALNLAIFGTLKHGDIVVSSRMEHNAVIRPLLELERRGIIQVRWAKITQDGRLDLENLFELATEKKVRMIAITGMSNVTGVIPPFWEIGEFCRRGDIICLIDGSQLAGTYPVNVDEDLIDIFVFTGHKSLYGVPGTGGLFIGERAKPVKPLIWGGTGGYAELPDLPDVLPERYEAGTPNAPGIVALGAGLKWLLDIGIEKIHSYKQKALRLMLNEFKEIHAVRLFGPQDDIDRGAVIPITIDGIKPQKVAQLLWKRYKIAIRAGFHCAPHIHFDLGAKDGTIRFSFGALNTQKDAEYAIEAVKELIADELR